jgi:hypothetical protein
MNAPLPMRPPPPQEVRIGLWGAPASGKTTYLASLNIATNRWQGPGNWIMNGVDDVSSDFLSDSTDLLVRQRRFPAATSDNRNLLFRFTGSTGAPPPPVHEPKRRMFGKQLQPSAPQLPDRVAFELDVLDVPGRLFGKPDDDKYRSSGAVDMGDGRAHSDDGPVEGAGNSEEDLLDHLEICSGIIYLFDPVRDADTGDAFQYFHRILGKLTQRCMEQERYSGHYLPQHLAVCITKFDHPEVYRSARRFGLTTQGVQPPYMPMVPNEYAKDFFQRLCYATGSTTADLVFQSLYNHFSPNLVRVFVTSSVGFYIGEGRRFRPNDFNNVENTNNGQARIKGAVHPINVLEPVIWLQQNVRGMGPRPW